MTALRSRWDGASREASTPAARAAWDRFRDALAPFGLAASNAGLRPRGCDRSLLLDHPEVFRLGRSLLHVAHPYLSDPRYAEDEIRELDERELAILMMPPSASWYYPGASSVVLVAKPEITSRILPALAPLGAVRVSGETLHAAALRRAIARGYLEGLAQGLEEHAAELRKAAGRIA